MGTRLELQSLLESILGSRNVYFQPPETVRMSYPCIVYQRNDEVNQFADNRPYVHDKQYILTVVDKNPDSAILDKIVELPRSRYDRHFTADNLNHDVFTIYY